MLVFIEHVSSRNNNNDVEDEKHLLLWCPLYEDLRKTLFIQEWLNYTICDTLFMIIMSDTCNVGIFTLATKSNQTVYIRKYYFNCTFSVICTILNDMAEW